MKSIHIKPCPCCGSVPFVNQSSNSCTVMCDRIMFNTHSGMKVVSGKTNGEVVANWNKYVENFASDSLSR